jgi:uncharacterized membrane protein
MPKPNRHAKPMDANAAATPKPSARFDLIDVLRGIALAMMFAYHFCFDLNYFGVLKQDFYNDVRWIAWRAVILSSFLFLAGVGLSLAQAAGWSWARYWRRLSQIAGCAVLVSVGSYLAFPDSWIYFGVLHHIALASILALPFLRAPRVALVLGVVLIALGASAQHTFFDAKPWHWFGLMTFKPRTEDYVPLLPWFGVALVGIFVGNLLAQPTKQIHLVGWHADDVFTCTLAWGGRHSLLLYMLHQPFFIGALMATIGLPDAASR